MPAIGTTKFCANHQPEPIRPLATPADADTQIVKMTDVPASGRINEVATDLLKAVKALQPDNALKVRVRKFSKQNLTCTQRYALLQNLRIGLRFVGEWAICGR